MIIVGKYRLKGDTLPWWMCAMLWLRGYRFLEGIDGKKMWLPVTRLEPVFAMTDEEVEAIQKAERERQAQAIADANARGEGPEQQGKLIQPGRMIPRRH